MKRTLLTAISVCLILASIFGFFAASSGMDDISQILRFKRNQKADIIDFVDILDERVAELKQNEDERAEDEREFAESVVTDDVGGTQLSQGQQQYNAGANRIAKGQAEYDAAEKLYNEKLAEYRAAEQQISDAEDQLAEAKIQRDEGQARLDAATPAYERAKPVYDAINLIDSSDRISEYLAKRGYTSVQELKDAIREYEAGQAELNEANAKIADAEQQLSDGKAQLADAKVQLDDGKAQLDAAKAQLDDGKAQLASAKNQLSAGQSQLNDNVDKMNDLRDQLTKYDDVEDAVKTGIATLMDIDGIADKVTDETDYESVLTAAREYAEEDTDKLTDELDVRQSLCSLLRILCVVGVIAGIVGLAAALRPNGLKLRLALLAGGITAVGAAALNIYGFTKDYMYFAYALSDGSGDGSMQTLAMLILLAVALAAAILSAVCVKSYNGALAGSAPKKEKPVKPYDDDEEDEKPVPKKAKRRRAEKPRSLDYNDDDDDDDEEEKPLPKKAERRRSEAPKDIGGIKDIKELEEMTRRLNEETERLESEARQADYEAARREYEEALKKFEEARKRSGQK